MCASRAAATAAAPTRHAPRRGCTPTPGPGSPARVWGVEVWSERAEDALCCRGQEVLRGVRVVARAGQCTSTRSMDASMDTGNMLIESAASKRRVHKAATEMLAMVPGTQSGKQAEDVSATNAWIPWN
eukprot:363986-Chlamydomonas_euryale.AAC.15